MMSFQPTPGRRRWDRQRSISKRPPCSSVPRVKVLARGHGPAPRPSSGSRVRWARMPLPQGTAHSAHAGNRSVGTKRKSSTRLRPARSPVPVARAAGAMSSSRTSGTSLCNERTNRRLLMDRRISDSPCLHCRRASLQNPPYDNVPWPRQVEVRPPIAFAPQRQHRVRPASTAMNAPREMHSEKRILRIGTG